jgi:hypothetical protein
MKDINLLIIHSCPKSDIADGDIVHAEHVHLVSNKDSAKQYLASILHFLTLIGLSFSIFWPLIIENVVWYA